MATTTLTANQVTSLQQRHDFWAKKEHDAIMNEDAEALTNASQGKDKVLGEASAAGVTLVPWAAPEETETRPMPTSAKGRKDTTPRSVKEANAVADKAKKVAAEKAKATPEGATKAKVVRAKKEKVLQPCLDGCGAQVGGNFKMGHDAKLKSLILKIERGEADMADLPEIAQELVTFKKGEVETIKDSKGAVKEKRQTYVCTKAPVRFPGREMVLTTR